MKNIKLPIELPDYLASWLEDISKEIGMTPSDFITNILHRYYDVWKIGRDSVYLLSKEKIVFNLDELVNEFSKLYVSHKNSLFIIRQFISWLKVKGLDIKSDWFENENLINEFLKDYTSTRNLSKVSLHIYKMILRKFINFVKEKMKG